MQNLLTINMRMASGEIVYAFAFAQSATDGGQLSKALIGSVVASLLFIALVLGFCTVCAVILYRRAKTPRLPHESLIEELEADMMEELRN